MALKSNKRMIEIATNRFGHARTSTTCAGAWARFQEGERAIEFIRGERSRLDPVAMAKLDRYWGLAVKQIDTLCPITFSQAAQQDLKRRLYEQRKKTERLQRKRRKRLGR